MTEEQSAHPMSLSLLASLADTIPSMETSMEKTILAAAESSAGGGFMGLILLIGIIWFICYALSSKDETYDVDIKRQTTGTIKKRR